MPIVESNSWDMVTSFCFKTPDWHGWWVVAEGQILGSSVNSPTLLHAAPTELCYLSWPDGDSRSRQVLGSPPPEWRGACARVCVSGSLRPVKRARIRSYGATILLPCWTRTGYKKQEVHMPTFCPFPLDFVIIHSFIHSLHEVCPSLFPPCSTIPSLRPCSLMIHPIPLGKSCVLHRPS